jgi:hypothetical protein
MTLDGNSSTTASIVGLSGFNDYAYNVTLFKVQSLAQGDHTLDVALVDYIFSNGTTMGSLMRFDSALVNDTAPYVVSPSQSGAGTATSTVIPPTATGSAGTSHSWVAFTLSICKV